MAPMTPIGFTAEMGVTPETPAASTNRIAKTAGKNKRNVERCRRVIFCVGYAGYQKI